MGAPEALKSEIAKRLKKACALPAMSYGFYEDDETEGRCRPPTLADLLASRAQGLHKCTNCGAQLLRGAESRVCVACAMPSSFWPAKRPGRRHERESGPGSDFDNSIALKRFLESYNLGGDVSNAASVAASSNALGMANSLQSAEWKEHTDKAAAHQASLNVDKETYELSTSCEPTETTNSGKLSDPFFDHDDDIWVAASPKRNHDVPTNGEAFSLDVSLWSGIKLNPEECTEKLSQDNNASFVQGTVLQSNAASSSQGLETMKLKQNVRTKESEDIFDAGLQMAFSSQDNDGIARETDWDDFYSSEPSWQAATSQNPGVSQSKLMETENSNTSLGLLEGNCNRVVNDPFLPMSDTLDLLSSIQNQTNDKLHEVASSGQTSADDNKEHMVNSLLEQMHDLSFMLADHLVIPPKMAGDNGSPD